MSGSHEEERLAHIAPDEALKRRDFLQRTAVAAGLTTAAATLLPADTLVAEAARRQRRKPLPAARNMPVDTFVVLMMENRSFDHYLGWLPGADGRQAGLEFADTEGKVHPSQRLAPDWQGCGHPDPDHSRKGGLVQLNGGKCDGFLRSGHNDEFAISYYEDGDLGFIQDAAKQYLAFDRFFCSLLGSTFPNREYLWAAESYGQMGNAVPPQAGYDTGFPDTTIFAALDRAGVSNQYFFVDLPVAALWGMPGLARSRPVADFYTRAATGTLPHVSFVDPFFAAAAGEGPGMSGDEHPHGDVRAGQAFMADIAHAVMESPQWERTALFIVYDEWGGFFDHVAPPRVPDQRGSKDPLKDFRQMGFRIPAVAISPWVGKGVSHTVYGFESILKMIEHRFGLEPLTVRDRYANNIARAFDWEAKPRLEPAALPDPAAVVSAPCQGNPDGAARVKEHDLLELETSGWLDRLGFEFRRARPEDAFRQPDTVRQGLAS